MFLLSAKRRILHHYICFAIKEAEIMSYKFCRAYFILFLDFFIILPADVDDFRIFVDEDDLTRSQQQQAYTDNAWTASGIENDLASHFCFESHVPGPFRGNMAGSGILF